MQLRVFKANEADMEAGFLMADSKASCKKKFKHSDIIRVSKAAVAANQGMSDNIRFATKFIASKFKLS